MKPTIISNGCSRQCDSRHTAVILVRRWELVACAWNYQVNVAFFVDRAPFVVGLSRLERHWPVACGANGKSRFLGSHRYLQKRARGHTLYIRSGIGFSTQKIPKSCPTHSVKPSSRPNSKQDIHSHSSLSSPIRPPVRHWPSGPCDPLLSPLVPLSRRVLSEPPAWSTVGDRIIVG